MPYIKEEKREVLNPAIEAILNSLRELESDDPDNSSAGNLNYVFTSILRHMYTRAKYDDVNEVIGILECCKQEWYRRVAAPYEDQKCYDNSDVYDLPT